MAKSKRTRLGGKWLGSSVIVEKNDGFQVFVSGTLAPQMQARHADVASVIIGEGLAKVPVKVIGQGTTIAEFIMYRRDAEDFQHWVANNCGNNG